MVDIPTPPQQKQDKPMAGPLPPVAGSEGIEPQNSQAAAGASTAPSTPVTPGLPPVPSGQPASQTGKPAPSPSNIPAPTSVAKPPVSTTVPSTPSAPPSTAAPSTPEPPTASRGQINPALGTEPKIPGMPPTGDNSANSPLVGAPSVPGAPGASLSQSVSLPETPTPGAFVPKTPGLGISGAGQIPTTPPVAPPQKKRGRMWLWLTIIVVVLLVAVGVVYFFFFRSTTPAQTTEAPSLTEEQTTKPQSPAADSDLDNDGLTFAQEAILGSDPDKFDTDGDGFSDGEEFKNGYSPTTIGDVRLEQSIIDQVNALVPDSTSGSFEVIGETLATVYSGSGSYRCSVTGLNDNGSTNVVSLEIKDGKSRGEFARVVNNQDIKLAYIVDGQKIYFGNADDNKYVELIYDPITGVGASADINGNGVPEFKVSGFIFTSEALLTAANPTKIECSVADIADARFVVSADQLIEITQAADHAIKADN